MLEILRNNNVQANFEKCQFFRNEIEYLGHRLSSQGVAPLKMKIDAISKATQPKDITSLRSFLGLLNFYSKFLPNLQSHQLLQKNSVFKWSEECKQVFNECKALIINSPVLSFYDTTKPLTIVCDAGPYGVGAVLNVVENNEERPVYMVSASLSQAERNYSQLHREALAVVFAFRKFHKFVYGHFVTVYTDCKALQSILCGKKDLGTVINCRFLRWILFLQNYNIEVKFRPSDKTKNADALSTAQTLELANQGPSTSQSINKFKHRLGPKEAPYSKQKYTQNHTQNRTQNKNKGCSRCGRYSHKGDCPAKSWECYVCHKIGHTSKVCRNKNKQRNYRT